jgi:hypothetical protein
VTAPADGSGCGVAPADVVGAAILCGLVAHALAGAPVELLALEALLAGAAATVIGAGWALVRGLFGPSHPPRPHAGDPRHDECGRAPRKDRP